MKIQREQNKKWRTVLTLFAMSFAILMMAILPVKAASPARVKKVKAYYDSMTSIQLSWKKVQGANSYEIYRCNANDCKYKKVKETSATSWTDSERDGSKYYYRVRAKKGNSLGAFSKRSVSLYADLVANQSEYKKHLVNFDNIKNARDLGGYETSDGGVIKSKKILRTGKISGASQADLYKLANSYHIKKDFDLRRVSKTKSEPDKEISGAEFENISLFGSDFYVSTSGIKIKKYKNQEEKFVKLMKYNKVVNHYTGMYHYLLYSKHSKKKMKKLFREIIDLKGGSFLFHCSAGKDRTGVSGALIMAALGCDDETILMDFSMSNFSYLSGTVRKLNLADSLDISDEGKLAQQCANGVSGELLEQEIIQINKDYGSLYNYIVEYLGISKEDIQKLREYYVTYN